MTSTNIYTNKFILQIQSISLPNKYLNWYCQIIDRAQKRATTRKTAKEVCGHIEGHHIVPDCFLLIEKEKGQRVG